jgi:hypothetical protein
LTLPPQPQGFGTAFRLTLVTSDPSLAAAADRSDVDYIGIDLDVLGKAARQSDEDSRLSDHKAEDLATIGGSVTKAKLFARVNPINSQTPFEIENVLRRGAQAIMLPYFRTVEEVAQFVGMVGKRAQISILLETASAAVRIREIVAVPGIQEVVVGLNDLRRELGVANHFEVLASPLLDALAREVRDAGLALAVGGVADPGDNALPIPPDLVLAQYPRLGATGAWLSRSLLRRVTSEKDLDRAICAIRARLTDWGSASPQSLEAARGELADRARQLAAAE